jgi:hypothetical protein
MLFLTLIKFSKPKLLLDSFDELQYVWLIFATMINLIKECHFQNYLMKEPKIIIARHQHNNFS